MTRRQTAKHQKGTAPVNELNELRVGPRLAPKWYSVAEVAEQLGYGLSKTKLLIATGQIRSLKDGGHQRIPPEWVDEYVARRVAEECA
ncbi:MAG: excisionase family DNA-binding protein [Pseudonocardiales bacterium]|nr:excisionase family DNA-binding protein [Pseudonocardiales bacterium]